MKFEIIETRDPEKVKELIYELRKFESNFDKELKSPEEITDKLIEWMKRKLTSPNTFLFLAVSDGRPLGYVFGWIEKRSKNYWKTHRYGYICDIFVKEEFRGKGVGKALMEKAENWLREKGIEYINLEVYSKNPFMKFYENLGYERLSVRMKKCL